MLIGSTNSALKGPRNTQSPKPGSEIEGRKDKDSFWKDRADELRELLLFIDQDTLEDTGRIVKSIGDGLKGAWQQIRDIPSKVFDLPVIADKVDEDKQRQLIELGETLGRVAGFVATGGHALGGALKVASGHQQKDTSRKLDGIMDMATAATLGATVAGLPGARAVLAPLAAGFNIFRGSYNAGHGYRTNDERKQWQGLLDAVRSAGSAGRLLKSHGAFFNVAGIALAPIAGALQAGRGLYDLNTGLKNDDNKKQLKGLVDIAAAVGTGLAFASGAAIIPGIALAVAAGAVKIAYELSPGARKKIDPILDRMEPKLTKVVEGADKLSKPVRNAWRKVISRFVKKTEPDLPGKLIHAQLAELSQLLFSDGDYTKQEERRLKSALEELGQGSQTPSRNEAPLPINRIALKGHLKSKEQRVDFLRYMLVAAYYDNEEKPAEAGFLDNLAAALEVSPEDMKALRKEREEFQRSILALQGLNTDPAEPESGRQSGRDRSPR
ncbi:MAG: TerB family tellurite resistance protein [Candidatus Eremiobacteraeota bacterium]|nr:TerB family tellurite resistance protein [Candidatus Eremiobacteraeota bacterium]